MPAGKRALFVEGYGVVEVRMSKLNSGQQRQQKFRASEQQKAQVRHRDKHGVDSTRPFCLVS